MSNVYEFEHTDTFGGEANYAWVKRGTVTMPELTHYGYDGSGNTYARANRIERRELVKAVKARTGLTGVRCEVTETGNCEYTIRPRGMNQVVFITFVEAKP